MTKDFNNIRVAVTGGIGSGKSVMCSRLAKRGINVYDCDAAAKMLMRTDKELQRQLASLVGEAVYIEGQLQKQVLATFLLASEEHKQQVNDVVHPAVARHFMQSGYRWLESAILFDSRFDTRIDFDCVVCVTAPLELRIQRVMDRDHISRAKTLEWIGRQMPQEEVVRRSTYQLVSGRDDVEKQVDDMLLQMHRDFDGV